MKLNLTQKKIEHLPNFRQKTRTEYSSACPNPSCTADQDGFLFWPTTGNYWCRCCGLKGHISTGSEWTIEDRQRLERIEQRRKQNKMAITRRALLSLSIKTVANYHENLTNGLREYWYGYGLDDNSINEYLLGYSKSCPTFSNSPSLTIPIFYKQRLLSIRHRLLTPPEVGGKYRPERAGLPAVIFNADLLLNTRDTIVLVEGEIKSMVLCQYGFLSVGIPGASSLKDKWLDMFSNHREIIVIMDPGAELQALEISQRIGSNSRAVSMNCKPDDFFVIHNGTPREFSELIGVYNGTGFI